MTAIYSVLHMLVDGVCAFAMFGTFLKQEQGYFYVLVYNFCAFALPMPFGAALDLLHAKSGKHLSFAAAGMGVVLTLIGAVTHPVILGIGNALFHIGGGVGTIQEDERKGWRGRGLGVFVAPGALGLYLGTQLAKNQAGMEWLSGAGLILVIICVGTACRLWRGGKRLMAAGTSAADADRGHTEAAGGCGKGIMADRAGQGVFSGGVISPAVCMFLVVILRSYIGMAVTFPWKTTAFAAAISTLAIVFGKAAGGFAAAEFGFLKTAVVSLSAAAFLYLFSGFMPAGAGALFLFNMTMPLTLYLLIRRLPQLPGFSFGFLTFGLFLGFLPEYFGLHIWQNSRMIGCVGSVISLLILTAGISRAGESSI